MRLYLNHSCRKKSGVLFLICFLIARLSFRSLLSSGFILALCSFFSSSTISTFSSFSSFFCSGFSFGSFSFLTLVVSFSLFFVFGFSFVSSAFFSSS